MQTFQDRISNLGIRQDVLAVTVGCKPSAFNRYLRGSRAMPQWVRQKLEEVLVGLEQVVERGK